MSNDGLRREVVCDICRRPFKEVKKRYYCAHCKKYFYVCEYCQETMPKCTYCGVRLTKKTAPNIYV